MDPEEADSITPVGMSALAVRLIADALMYRLSPPKQTRRFAYFKHDADLLPAAQRQVARLLDGFHRDTQAVYDIQGFSDKGSDLLIRLTLPSGVMTCVSLQVKSHAEMLDSGLASKLLVQWQQSVDAYNPSRYFILLFCDLTSKPHQAASRKVQAARAKKAAVSVIDAPYLVNFLALSSSQMDAILTGVMRKGDPVLEEARARFADMSAPAISVVLAIASQMIGTGSGLRRQDFESDTWCGRLITSLSLTGRYYGDPPAPPIAISLQRSRSVPGHYDFNSQFARLEEQLEDELVVMGDRYMLRLGDWQALFALMLEGTVKYGYTNSELTAYAVSILWPP